MKRKKHVYGILTAIMVLSAFLRLWGVTFGLPHIFYIDSTKITKRAKHIAHNILSNRWDIDPKFYQYPTFFTNLLAAEYIAYGLGYGIVTSLTGKHETMREAIDTLFRKANPAYKYDPYPPVFYLIARLNNVLAGVLTVLLIFFLSKIAFDDDDRIALLSAFFLSVMFLHVKHSKYPMADVILGFWTVAAMIYIVRMSTRVDLYDYLFAGLCIGFGTSTKYLTIFLLPSFLLNVVYQRWRNRKDDIIARKIVTFGLLGLLMVPMGFLIGTPTFLTYPHRYMQRAAGEYRGMGSAERGGKYGNTQRGFLDYFFNSQPSWFEPHTINSLWGAMGAPLLIVVSMAFIYFIYIATDTKREDYILYWDFLLFLILFYFFLAGAGKNRIVRYFVIAVPFMAVMASKFLVDMIDRIPGAWVKRHTNLLLFAVALSLAFPTTLRAARYNHLMTHTNNRVIAGRWIEEHIPKGSKLWMPILYPPCVSADEYAITFYRSQQKKAEGVVPYKKLKEQGFDYIILSSYDYGPAYSKEALDDYPEGTKAMLQFYKEAEENAPWSKIFESNLVDIPGPTIKIFKVSKEPPRQDGN